MINLLIHFKKRSIVVILITYCLIVLSRKIIYNPDCLEQLAGPEGRRDGRRMAIVAAMNADRNSRIDNDSDGRVPGQVNLTTLNRWIKERRCPPIDPILSLCNNMAGLTLADFFAYDDGAPLFVDIKQESQVVNKKKQTETSSDFSETTMVRMENKYLKEIAQLYERERGLTDIIVQQEKDIRKLHNIIDTLREPISITKMANGLGHQEEEKANSLKAAEDIYEDGE